MAEQRIWRLRKRHQTVDAEIHDHLTTVELRFLLNGTVSYSRMHPSRMAALSEAAVRRAELEREGWLFHW
ncbi:MAG: hypothetical protein LBQ09_10605 [Acidobacteriaceae bacterium]|jgi:hypothetical protein|nr:hypothetical protein [Acidobacteriaceae bacterium]